MNYELLLAFARHYTPEIAAILYVTGVVLLLLSIGRQHRQSGQLTRTVASLHDAAESDALTRQQLQTQIHELTERFESLLQRQEQVEKRAPDSRRIDRAVRIVKRGAGNEETLHDMGLSDGEARLLLRLHGEKSAIEKKAPVAKPISSQAQALAEAMRA